MIVIERYKEIILTLTLIFLNNVLLSQEEARIVDYTNPYEYTIGGISVSGVRFLDTNALIGLSGLRVDQRVEIPGESITNAVKKLWQQGLFSDVRITIAKSVADTVYLDIALQERPRISLIRYNGLKTSETQDLSEKINMPIGTQVTSYQLNNTERIIKEHFIEKGFLNTSVEFVQKDDPDRPNNVILTIDVNKMEKVKIEDIIFAGNDNFTTKQLRKKMKNTKKKNMNFFKASKFISEKYDEDKESLYTFYNDNGYKDFKILGDSLYPVSDERVGLLIRIEEGKQYFLRDINWVGNSVYRKEDLDRILNIERGSVYNQSHLDDRLNGSSGAQDAVSNLYQDNGYLFSRLTPVESNIENDSIDLEVRIYEGEQAYLNNIIISGNTRTNEHIARRELYTLPGDLFSKNKILRSIRQLGVIGHFDPEKINPNVVPDPANGTVDLLYKLEERANDQFEISGGWGAGMLVGSVGVHFNNFAIRNFFKLNEWRPYPSGDGQSLSVRAQSNGRLYQSYNISFMEPWLGGKKPNSFSVSIYRSLMNYGGRKGSSNYQSMITNGASVGLGKRLEWPDDFFSLFGEINYQRYRLNDFSYYHFLFSDGTSNMLTFTTRLTRFSTGPNLIYPTNGSTFTLSVQATPPYSLISGANMVGATDREKYKWIEFHKWTFKADYYHPVTQNDKLILNAKFAFGYLGHYNKDIGPSPFENYNMGGSGMTGYSLYGREIIAMRGYIDGSVTPTDEKTGSPIGNVYSKFTLELRYPVSLNQQATIYGLAFLEAGKAWYEINQYNPFRMKRAAGIGVRANLPMFGLLGVDWGWGFDPVDDPAAFPDANKGQFSFTMGQQF
jgi:outer membrane protein insertion porin family